MTNSLTVHPPQNDLIAFGLGKLQPDESQRVEEHLEGCPDCCATILNLQDDTFVNLVRESGKLTPIGAQADATIDVGSGTITRAATPAALPAELRDHARYEIQGLIGRGGMGDVYKAQHKVMNRPVALKVIKPELVQNEAARQRFHREVQAAARLHDRNIVTAYDAEQAGGLHFLVMEYVDGVNLDEVVRRRGALPVAEACDYIRQAAKGLQHAHELGMVHRDIKPHNLMLSQAGVVKILDFGLASFVSELAADEVLAADADSVPEPSAPRHTLEQLTLMGTMMGTPDYISPEQAKNSHTADIRADIYSLGCTFYTLLTGRPPFKPSSLVDKLKAHAEQVPPRLSECRCDVPASIEDVLLRMLAKDPAERFQTPHKVVAALEAAAASTSTSAGQLAPQRDAARPRSMVLTAVAALLIAAIAATVFYIQTNQGVVRVEVADESLQVKLSGRTIEMKDGETPLTIQVGEPKLVVQRGDFKFETDSFQLRRGDQVALKVEVQAGEIVVLKDGRRFGAKPLPYSAAQAKQTPPPLTIGMNDEFGMLFQGRLVAPAELSRVLGEALKENPARQVAIDLPKKKWTVAGHVDQLEQIAQIAGAKFIRRPAWSEIRIVFGVEESGAHTLDIQGPGYNATGFLNDHLPSVQEVIAKNPTLPVVIEITEGIRLSDPKFTLGMAQINSAAETAGAKVRVVRTRRDTVNAPESLDQIKELHRLQGHTGSIERLAFIDDTRFVSAGLQGEEYVWDARQGKRIRALTEHDRLVTVVAAAPAVGLFATGDSYGQIRLWNKDLTTTGTIKGPERILVTLAMSADGSLLMSSGATFSQDPALLAEALMPRIWNTKTQELVRTLDSKSGLIMAAAFTPDGKRLVTGGMAKHLSVWDVATGELLSTIELGMEVRTLSLSPDGRLAAVASSDPVVIVDLQTKEVTHRLNGHTLRVQSVSFLPDGRHVVSGSQDKTWRVWSLAESREVAQVAGTTPHTQTLAVSPDGKLVAGGGGEPYDHATQSFPKNGDYDLRVWELPASLQPIEGASANRIVVELSADGQFRLEGRPISAMGLAKHLQSTLKENPQREIHVLPADRFRGPPFQALVGLVRAAGGKNVTWPGQELADTSLVEIKRFTGHSRPVNFVTFSPDGKLIASTSGMPRGDNTVRIWDRETGQTLHVLEGHQASITFAAFSPDGSRLLTGDITRRQVLWNPATGERIKGWIWKGTDESEVTHINEVVFSADGRRIFFVQVGAKPAIQVADVDSGERLKTFPLDGLGMPAIALTADGSQLLVPRADGTVELLEAQTGEKLRTYAAAPIDKAESPNALAVAISPDGKKVAAGYKAHTIRIWDFATGAVVRDIRTENFTTGRLAFLADSRRIVASGPVVQAHSASPVACLVDTDTGDILARAPAILGHGQAFALEPDQQHILTGGGWYFETRERQTITTADNDLRLWRLPETVLPPPPQPEKINLLRELPGSKEWITAVAYPDNDRAVTVAVDGVVRVWKKGGAELDSHQLPFGGQADISPDGRLVVVASAANDKDVATVALWELDGWKERWKIEVPTTTTKFTPKFLVDVRFAPNDRVLVRSNVDSGLAIVDTADGKVLSRYPAKGPPIGAASLSPDGQRLFVRQMAPAPLGRIYRVEDGSELAQIDTRDVVLDAVWSRDGAHLILAESTLSEGRIAVFEASTGKLIRRWVAEPKGIESLALGQGNLLVTGGLTRIAVWDWSSEKLLAAAYSPKQDGDARLAIALSPDGKRLISGGSRWLDGEDQLPRLWQLPEAINARKLIGKWKVTVEKGKAWMTFAEFKADGKMSFTGQEETFEVFGTYQVTGNKLLLKMKTVDNKELDEETTILKLTDDALTTRSEDGKELTFERVEAK